MTWQVLMRRLTLLVRDLSRLWRLGGGMGGLGTWFVDGLRRPC